MAARERYDEIADDLVARTPGAAVGQMMGMPCVKVDGKLIGGFWREGDAVVFKLPDDAEREAALTLEGAHLFDPMRGRPMKQWVVVPVAHAEKWARLLDQSLASKG